MAENKCNHDPNSTFTTLTKNNRKTMVNPEILNYFCTNCKGIYKFQRDGSGKLAIVQSK